MKGGHKICNLFNTVDWTLMNIKIRKRMTHHECMSKCNNGKKLMWSSWAMEFLIHSSLIRLQVYIGYIQAWHVFVNLFGEKRHWRALGKVLSFFWQVNLQMGFFLSFFLGIVENRGWVNSIIKWLAPIQGFTVIVTIFVRFSHHKNNNYA